MGLLARVRDFVGGPSRRLAGDLTAAYLEELRLARQLRLHAERVPYPNLAAPLLGLADRQERHAALLRERVGGLGGNVGADGVGVPREGRNYWERLTFDLADLRALSQRYLELTHYWDVDAESAALCARLAHEDGEACHLIGDLIARSDPHAAD